MSLKEQTANSVKWNTIATVFTMVIGILQVAILTRLLEKSDFGLIAIASMVIAFTDIFAELGITAALIHKQDISHNEYSSVYWLNLTMSIVICGLTMLAAPLVSTFYKEPSLTLIVRLLSLKIVFTAFGKMFQTIKTKNLEFNFISKVRILTSIIGIVTSTTLACLGFGVMSLVYAQLLQIIVNQSVFAFAGMKQMRLMFHFSFSEVKDVLTIGGYQIGTQLLDFIAARVDVFLIGRFFSMEQLGVYNIAKELIVKPFTIINSITSNVFSAAFAKIQDNISSVIANYSKLVKTVTMLSFPIYACLFIFADLMVGILYAPSFAEVAVFIRIMAAMGICNSITSQGAPVMIAMGRTDLGLRWTLVRILMSTSIMLFTASISVYAVAYGETMLAVIAVFIYFLIVLKQLMKGLELKRYLSIFSVIFGGVILLSFPFAIANMLLSVPAFLQFVMLAVYGGLYFLFLQKFFNSELKEIMGLVLRRKSSN
jgi:O-antigen/teichoic acid export membrane protein